MTCATVNVDGEPTYFDNFERVQVSFPAEDDWPVCAHCGGELDEDENGATVHQDPSNDDHRPVAESGPGSWCNSAAITVDEEENSVTVTISVGDPRGAFAMTVRKVDRSGYCRKCGNSLDTAEDGSTVHTDPSQDGHKPEPDGERLILHVPYPEQGWLHMPLTKLHEGTYLIGGQ